jgi:hypothetical protein
MVLFVLQLCMTLEPIQLSSTLFAQPGLLQAMILDLDQNTPGWISTSEFPIRIQFVCLQHRAWFLLRWAEYMVHE